MTVRFTAVATLVGYILTIPAANLAVEHYGKVPVGFGQMAPAGVYAVGIALVLRDLARKAAGRWPVIAAIGVGAVLSYWLASPALAIASCAAFALSEALDMAVHEPLRKRDLLAAMAASNLVGLIADSLLFLWLAFGSLQYLLGQLLGKAWMTLLAVAIITALRRARTASI